MSAPSGSDNDTKGPGRTVSLEKCQRLVQGCTEAELAKSLALLQQPRLDLVFVWGGREGQAKQQKRISAIRPVATAL